MESANLHHYLEDQLVGSSSSSSSSFTSSLLATTPPSCYGVGTTTSHAWTPSILNTNGFSPYPSEKHQEINSSLLSSQYSSMSPDLSYHWSNNTTGNFTTELLGQDSQHSRIKEEISDRCYLKYKEILSSPSSSFDELSLKNVQKSMQVPDDLGSKFLLKSFSSGNLYSDYSSNAVGNSGRGCSQIFPSVNISNLNQLGLTNPGSFDMNLQALDLLTSSRLSGSFSPSSHNQIGISSSDGFSYGFDPMQQSHEVPLYGSSKVSGDSLSKGGAESKRNSSKMEPKPIPTAPKKSRLEARASCPPLKVRKEKLGDRIAALQQLVAPFGKTDTASVLMEAIGYIKFLQSQVETLSVPYMKTSRNNTSRAMNGGALGNENHEESKRDLKSRGLCLVPLSCLSYITECGGAAVWPPPHFGGPT